MERKSTYITILILLAISIVLAYIFRNSLRIGDERKETISPVESIVREHLRKSDKIKNPDQLYLSEMTPYLSSYADSKKGMELARRIHSHQLLIETMQEMDTEGVVQELVKKRQEELDQLERQFKFEDGLYTSTYIGEQLAVRFHIRGNRMSSLRLLVIDTLSKKVLHDAPLNSDPKEIFTGPDGRVGIVTKYFHDTLCPPLYDRVDSISRFPYSQSSTWVAYQGEHFSIVSNSGKLTECIFDEICNEGSSFWDGDLISYLTVRSNHLYGAIDKDTGEIIIPLQQTSKEQAEVPLESALKKAMK